MHSTVCRCLMTLILLFAAEVSVYAQWKVATTFTVSDLPVGIGGVLYYENGVLWSGSASTWFSTDSGITWHQPDIMPYGYCADISFIDPSHGLISTSVGLFLTNDAGRVWRLVQPGSFLKAQFLVSPDSIGAFEETQGFFRSTDGGSTFQITYNLNTFYRGFSFAIAPDGTLYLVAGDWYSQSGSTYVSTDHGKTWSNQSRNVDNDAWTLAVDSCNWQLLYLADEQYWAWISSHAGNGLSKIVVSTDGGHSWSIRQEQPVPFYSGTLVNTANAVFAGTLDETVGVLRSTDQGMTWKSIGGPPVPQDSRNITALNDNRLFALDTNGTIWETFNSGGDSILTPGRTAPSIFPDTLFLTDTVYCDSIVRTITIQKAPCNAASITSQHIIGQDAPGYSMASVTEDSVKILFFGDKKGENDASIVFALDNGEYDTIRLVGYSSNPTPLSVTTVTNAGTDTIGQTVNVPIILRGLSQTEDIDLVLNYDPALHYLGSVDTANAPLDIPGEEWAGRSELHIPNAYSGTVGYSRFILFYDAEKRTATFDSIIILSGSPCKYFVPSLPATSTITSPNGCGTDILSSFMESGKIPNFSIRPNPASGVTELISSENVSSEIGIYNMLGQNVEHLSANLSKDTPLSIPLPEPAGVYIVRIQTLFGTVSRRIVVEK